jgi:hypothetical protein
MTSATVRSSVENDGVLEDPTAYLDAISDDESPEADEDLDSLEPWDMDRQEVFADLTSELGPFAWHRVAQLADCGQIDPRAVLRSIRRDRRAAGKMPFAVRRCDRRAGRSRARRTGRVTRGPAPTRPRPRDDRSPDPAEEAA